MRWRDRLKRQELSAEQIQAALRSRRAYTQEILVKGVPAVIAALGVLSMILGFAAVQVVGLALPWAIVVVLAALLAVVFEGGYRALRTWERTLPASSPKAQLEDLIREGHEVRKWAPGQKNSEVRLRVATWQAKAAEFLHEHFVAYWDDFNRSGVPAADTGKASLIKHLRKKLDFLNAIARGETPPKAQISNELRPLLGEFMLLADSAQHAVDRDDLTAVIKEAREFDRRMKFMLETFAPELAAQLGAWSGYPWELGSGDQAAEKISERARSHADIVNKLRDRGE